MPAALRARFTEFYVEDVVNRDDLHVIVREYLKDVATAAPINDIVEFYLEARRLAGESLLGSVLHQLIILTITRWIWS